MARSCKSRCVCKEPICKSFSPNIKTFGSVTLNVDEYETIRLIDLEKKTQEECSKLMGVARTTIQSIYENARFKIAIALVNVRNLKIEGGEYYVSSQNKTCLKTPKEKLNMIIAVTILSDNSINQHFGRSETFKLYEVQNGAVKKVSLLPANVEDHHANPSLLKENNVDAVICGGLGGRMMTDFMSVGIHVFSGVNGDADSAVEALLRSEIVETIDSSSCGHHEEHECCCHDHDDDHECCHEGKHNHEGCCHEHEEHHHEGCCCHNHKK